MGSTGKIISELKKLMIENNIKIKTNADVKELVLENNKIKKIITEESISDFDLVVCNADPPTVYSEMIKGLKIKSPFQIKKITLLDGFVCSFFGTTKV